MTKFQKKVPANLVPAAAVIREGQALFGMIGRKAHVDRSHPPRFGMLGLTFNFPWEGVAAGVCRRRVEFLRER